MSIRRTFFSVSKDSGCSVGYQQTSGNVSSGNEKCYECHLCKRPMTDKRAVIIHIRSKHTGERPYKCNHTGCNKKFSCKPYLSQHNKTHNEKSFKCNENGCNKSFTMQSYLSHHKKTHNEKSIKCTENGCNKSFTRKPYLKQHLKNTHSKNKLNYRAGLNQLMDSREENHTKPERSNLSCLCITCDKGFQKHTQMIRHVKQVHATGTIKKIELKHILTKYFRRIQSKHFGCKESFKKKHRSDNHVKKHTRSDGCNARAKRDEHVQTEVDREKLFKNKFQQYADLRKKNHPNDVIKTNLNYLCPKCAKGFEREEQLVLHLNDTHNVPIVYCAICDLPLLNENSRRKHVEKYHLQLE